MKRYFRILIFVIFTVFTSNATQAKSVTEIVAHKTIKQSFNTLSSPKGISYQWFFNGKKLGLNGQKIKSVAPGNYTVEITDEKGSKTLSSIKVPKVQANQTTTIFTIGDSTVSDYNSYYYPQTGWGQVLQYFFNKENIVVQNEAIGGTSSKSFYNYNWAAVKSQLDSGDFVFIQFGINDRNSSDPNRHAPAGVFEEYLRKFIAETQEKGAFPVLVSTVRRNSWTAEGLPYDSYHEHPQLTRNVATEDNVPLIDLDSMNYKLMVSVGPEYTPFLYLYTAPGEYPTSGAYKDGREDQVHFQEMGAIEMARFVTDGIQALSTDENVSKLIPHLKTLHQVKISASDKDYAGLITHTDSFPEGVNVTLKVKPDQYAEFKRWSSGSVDTVSENQLIQFTMGNQDTAFTAHVYYQPRLEITSPVNGNEYELGRDIELNVYAKGVNESNPELIVYEGSTEIATIDSAPYTVTLQDIETGEHTYIAKAHNTDGELMESEEITFSVDNGFPKIILLEPNSDKFYDLEDTIKLEVNAYDSDDSIAKIQFYLNNDVVAEITSKPYSYKLTNPGTGIYTFYARATDYNNNVTTTSSITASVGPITTFQENGAGYCGIKNNKGSIDTDHLYYTGDGFINTDNETGTTINYTVNFIESGEYKMVFRHSATSQRPGKVIVNGENVGNAAFPATATWDVWGFTSVNFTVEDTGKMPLSVVATGSSGLPNIDYMKIISLESINKVEVSTECLDHPEPEVPNSMHNEKINGNFIIYPVPANDYLMVKCLNNRSLSSISIFRLDGTLVKTVDFEESDIVEFQCNDLRSGLYLMQLHAGNELYTKKFNVVK